MFPSSSATAGAAGSNLLGNEGIATYLLRTCLGYKNSPRARFPAGSFLPSGFPSSIEISTHLFFQVSPPEYQLLEACKSSHLSIAQEPCKKQSNPESGPYHPLPLPTAHHTSIPFAHWRRPLPSKKPPLYHRAEKALKSSSELQDHPSSAAGRMSPGVSCAESSVPQPWELVRQLIRRRGGGHLRPDVAAAIRTRAVWSLW